MSLKSEIRNYVKAVGKAILEEAKTYADTAGGSAISFNVSNQDLQSDINEIINSQENENSGGGN